METTNMNMNKIFISGLGVILILVLGYMVFQTRGGQVVRESNGIIATIYKSPTCGCCGVYTSYMKGEGYDVVSENVADMSVIKKELGVPYELESCHTMEVGGYVVEGHVPEEAVQKLLTERPDIKGIGMAGMPSGSPGMPGPKNEPFEIYEINHDGTVGEMFMTI